MKRGSRYARDDQDAGQRHGNGLHVAQLARYGAKTVGGNELNTLTDGAASSPNSKQPQRVGGNHPRVADACTLTTSPARPPRGSTASRALPRGVRPPRRGYEQRGEHDVGQLEVQQRLHIGRLSPRCRRQHLDAPLPVLVQPFLGGAARAGTRRPG